LIKLRLKDLTEEYVEYFYYPHGVETFGVIRGDLKTGEAAAVSVTQADRPVAYYAHKACRGVERLLQEENAPPQEDTIAWH